MAQGSVKFFNTTKGYGFIRNEESDKDIFVHVSALERAGISNLNEGQRVSYEIITSRGRESAGELKLID